MRRGECVVRRGSSFEGGMWNYRPGAEGGGLCSLDFFLVRLDLGLGHMV